MLQTKPRPRLEADTESIMRASHADTARRNARVRDRRADTARISRSVVTMRMVSVIGSRSEPTIPVRRNADLLAHRQFGSMTEKVADYEKLLRNLSLRATENDAKLIKASLEKVG